MLKECSVENPGRPFYGLQAYLLVELLLLLNNVRVRNLPAQLVRPARSR
jgi:hypothetical protein